MEMSPNKAPSEMLRTPSCQSLRRFVALPENRSALKAVQRLAHFESKPHPRSRSLPLLFLHGSPGTGKSHLVRGLLQRIIRRQPDRTGRIISARDLARLLTDQPRTGAALGLEFRECDLLVVEDIQHLPASGTDALTALLDQRRARRRSSVVTGACGPAGLAHSSRRLTSRLAAGLVIGLESLSPSSRRELAHVLCERRRLYVDDGVLDWLARTPGGGARPIIGDMIRLQRLSRVHAPPLSLAIVTAELQDEQDSPIIERLADQVACRFGLTRNQLKGRNRRRGLLWPRQVAMYLARKLTKLSLARIGVCFGGYDHSTVLHACRKVEDRLKTDMSLPNELSELAARVN
jgi:chromosomal replication initiator protein